MFANRLIRPAKTVLRKLRSAYWARRGILPQLRVERHDLVLVKKLGTDYGGWTFVDCDELHGAVVLSCGLGEDASFDVEFATRYRATVVIVDPTPRAIEHFDAFSKRIGMGATTCYSTAGAQPAEAYDLSGVTDESFRLIEKALWNEETVLKFFQPSDPAYVSHSALNFQNDYRDDTSYIEVEATTVDRLLSDLNIVDVPLMKLDIEAAEIEVIIDMMEKNIRPRQILVEYDEMSVPSKLAKRRIESAHSALLGSRYTLVNFDAPNNFLYVRDELLIK